MRNTILLLLALLGLILMISACQSDDDDAAADDDVAADDDDNDDNDDSVDDDDDDDDDDNDNDNDDDDNDDNDIDPCDSSHEWLYDLTPGQRNIPFPNNLFTVADSSSATGRRVDLSGQTSLFLDEILKIFFFVRPALNQMEGFGVTSAMLVPTNAEPDMETLPDTADPGAADSVFLVRYDGDKTTPEFMPLEFEWRPDQQVLAALPYRPLLQNSTYLLVVTDSLLPSDSTCYAASDHFRYLRRLEANPANPDYDLLEPTRQEFAPLFAFLEEQVGVSRDRVVDATLFSTQWVTPDLESIRDQLKVIAAEDPPTISGWELLEDGATTDGIWDATYDTVNWFWDGQLKFDDDHAPLPNGYETIKARVILPDPTIYPQPWPAIVFMHGIFSSRHETDEVGRQLASYGFAVFGFDAVYQGDRGPDSVIEQGLRFFNFLQPLKWRANFQQDVSDEMWLGHLIQNLADLDLAPHASGGDGIPDLDTTRIAFMGHSMGAIHGGIAAAIDDEKDVYVFNAGAADYRDLALYSPNGEMVINIIETLSNLFHWELYSQLLMAVDLLLIPVELGDPMAYAPYVFDHPLDGLEDKPRRILHQMAAYDATLGSVSSGRLCTLFNLTQLEPVVWRLPDVPLGQTPFFGPAVYQYDTDIHELWYDVPETHLQAGHYLSTWRDNDEPEIIDPYSR
ncbi:MAG: hypothetical protein GX444_13815 [Myxococcales bacterium]|nr:hypothetical protein [Myxococcales bacterium]